MRSHLLTAPAVAGIAIAVAACSTAPSPAEDPAATFEEAESALDATADGATSRAVTVLTRKAGPTTYTHRILLGDERAPFDEITVEQVSPTHVVFTSGAARAEKEVERPVSVADVTSAIILAGLIRGGGGMAKKQTAAAIVGGEDCYGQDMTCTIPDFARAALNVTFAWSLSSMIDNHTWSFPCPTWTDWGRRKLGDIEECCQEHDRRLYCGAEDLTTINGDFGACVTTKLWNVCNGVNRLIAAPIGALMGAAVEVMTQSGAGSYPEAAARKEQRKASCMCGGTEPTALCASSPCRATLCSSERARRAPRPEDFSVACTP
jgi:hypothetical protein